MKTETLIQHRDIIYHMRTMARAACRASDDDYIRDYHKKQVEALKVAWLLMNDEIISALPDRVECTHTEHCCVYHGCKYSYHDEDEKCPVCTKEAVQSFPCEFCDPYDPYDQCEPIA